MKTALRVAGAVLAILPAGLGAEEHLPWPVHRMCADAQGIVVGERCGPMAVRIGEWLWRPDGETPAAGEEITIAGLDEHTRLLSRGLEVGRDGKKGRSMLGSQQLVCFLERKGVAWYAMGAAQDGSSGLIWLEDGNCFRYQPRDRGGRMLPIGWSLEAARDCPSEQALRSSIARGLADRQDWEEALAIVHPAERAVVLASYLLARSSPEGEEATYRDRVRRVLPNLGTAGVRELVLLLETAQGEDDLGPAVTVLGDFGPEARPALPLVTDLLDQPGRADSALVLDTLGRIGEATVAPRVLPYLAHRDLPVRAAAAKALAAFQYQDAAGDIAKGLPAGVDQGDAWHVYVMLSALRDLDGARAAVCTRNYIDRAAMVHVRDLLEPFLGE